MNNGIPGPGFFNFIKNVRANPVMYCYDLMKRYGDVVRCRSLQDIYLINNPVLAKDVFLNSHKSFDKNNFINNRLKEVMGDGVVLSTGDRWKRQRKTAQIIFSKNELQKLMPVILRCVDDTIPEWEHFALNSKSFNVHQETRKIVMKILAGCLFNLEDQQILNDLKKYFFIGNRYASNPTPFNLPGWVPMSQRSGLKYAENGIDTIMNTLIEERRQTGKHDGKLLAYIMDQHDEHNNPINDDEILTEAKNIFVAGYFSTSDVLSWLIYSVAQHDKWFEAIRDECRIFENTSNPDVLESAGDMQMFIHEVLRCYPPVWASSHHTISDFQLGDYLIPKDKTIMVSIYNLHHHPDFWVDPEKFNPHRFQSGPAFQEKAMFIPFGMGPRKCLGMGLARMIINIVLAKIVTHFRLTVNTKIVPKIQSRITLGAKTELEIFLQKC